MSVKLYVLPGSHPCAAVEVAMRRKGIPFQQINLLPMVPLDGGRAMAAMAPWMWGLGFVGLVVPKFEAHFTPCVEIGWRLARPHWGKGYAVEAAGVALRAAFGPLGLHEVVSLTVRSVSDQLQDLADEYPDPRRRDAPWRREWDWTMNTALPATAPWATRLAPQ